MKKLLFILFFIVPFFCFSQNKITIKSGESFIANIKGLYGKSLVFHQHIPGTRTNRIAIDEVVSIAGNVPTSRMEAITKENPDVKFLLGKFSRQDVRDQYDYTASLVEKEKVSSLVKKERVPPQLSAGDLVQKSAKLRLTGLAIGVGAGAVAATGAFDDMDSESIRAIAGISGAVIIGFYLAGEFTLIKAGKKMNSDAITLSAAKRGVGMAINF